MIIREDLDTKLRKALAIHYGLDKVYVEKIYIIYFGFNAYRIEIKTNDKFRWVHYLDDPYLMALHISFEDLVKSLIDKFEEDKRGVINDN